MRKLKYLLAAAILTFGCSDTSAKPTFIVTSQPLKLILMEIVGPRAEIECLVKPGDSPHTYSPKPSDAYKANIATALLYVSSGFDGWAATLPAKTKLQVISLLPADSRLKFEKSHVHFTDSTHWLEEGQHFDTSGEVDPHFWTDPLTVKALLGPLVDTLSKLDPDNAASYSAGAASFEQRLDLLHRQVESITSKARGNLVFLFHPSFNYFLKRYKMFYAGSIEEHPGVEPSPQAMAGLVAKIKTSGTRAIFSEPQLPDKPAKALAEAANVNLYVLDPNGGLEGRQTYTDLILFNARVFQTAFR